MEQVKQKIEEMVEEDAVEIDFEVIKKHRKTVQAEIQTASVVLGDIVEEK